MSSTPLDPSYKIVLLNNSYFKKGTIITFTGAFKFVDATGKTAVVLSASVSVDTEGLSELQITTQVNNSILLSLQKRYNEWKIQQSNTANYLSGVEDHLTTKLIF